MSNLYRKKPVTIQAEQWDGGPVRATEIINWILASGGTARYLDNFEPIGVDVLRIDTLEGTMSAVAGDYIIRGVQGEFYPCKADIFDATYEAVTS